MKKAMMIANSIKEYNLSLTTHKDFNTLDDIQSFQDLQADLLNTLPNHIRSGDEKIIGSFYTETRKALRYPFISYGTKKVVQVLMFDDDSKKYESIEEYSITLLKKLGFKPTFITETPRGYQFGIILKKPVFKYHKNSEVITQEYLLLKSMKEIITKKINCDIFGSHRMIGVWRNPLQHNFVYTSKKYYISTLSDLLFSSNASNEFAPGKQFQNDNKNSQQSQDLTCTMRLSKNTKIFKTIEKGFYEGNRNNYLFAIGFKIVFEDRSKVKNIEKELLQINKSYSNPLTDYEVQNITKSVIEYSQKMYTPQHTYSKRGKLSNEMWEKRIHGIKNRRAYAGYHTAKTRAVTTIKKIVETFIEMFEKGIVRPKNKDLAKQTSMSIRQIQRYKRKITTSKVLLEWIKSMGCKNIVIRAYVTLIENRVFSGPKCSLLKCSFVKKSQTIRSFLDSC